MKYRYYITDLNMGKVSGTNSEEDAKRYALSEDFFIVDSYTGMWLLSDGTEQEVAEVEFFDLDDEEVNEDDPDE